jgi:hypothetical protein
MCSTLLEADGSSGNQLPSEDVRADFKRLASTSRLPVSFRDMPPIERHPFVSVAHEEEEEEVSVSPSEHRVVAASGRRWVDGGEFSKHHCVERAISESNYSPYISRLILFISTRHDSLHWLQGVHRPLVRQH